MRAYELTGIEASPLRLTERPEPAPGHGQVAVAIKAVSLNYRDLNQAKASANAGLIPLSDGAGVITGIGPGVTGWSVGDRVAISFMTGWIEGPFSAAKQATSLGGGGVDGVLTERICLPAAAVVRLPDAMTFQQAATLPCAAVTAWAALFERRPVQPGETVLLLGTGGVSVFALQLAKQAGARVILTSSSDEKLERARALGADETINYRATPDWAGEVLARTGGAGVDMAVDVGGPATLNSTLVAVRHGGRISLMGVLTGVSGPIDTAVLLRKRITLQGIYVGPAEMLASVVKAAPEPVIDQVFGFEKAAEAYAYLASGSHFGKVVVALPG